MKKFFSGLFIPCILAFSLIFFTAFSFFLKNVPNLLEQSEARVSAESSLVVGNIQVYQPSELLGLFAENGWQACFIFKNEKTGKQYSAEVSSPMGNFVWPLPPGPYKVTLETLRYCKQSQTLAYISLRDQLPLTFELLKDQVLYLGHYYYEVGSIKQEISTILTKSYIKSLTASLIRTVSDKNEMILPELKAARGDLVVGRDFSKKIPKMSK